MYTYKLNLQVQVQYTVQLYLSTYTSTNTHIQVMYSVMTYEIPKNEVLLFDYLQELDWSTVMPHANNKAPPRPHIEDTRPLLQPFWYRLFSMTMLIVLVVGIIAVIGGVAWKKQQEKNRKRFF